MIIPRTIKKNTFDQTNKLIMYMETPIKIDDKTIFVIEKKSGWRGNSLLEKLIKRITTRT